MGPMNARKAANSAWAEVPTDEGFKLTGEALSLNVSNPFDVIEITVMTQAEQGAYPVKIATTTFDPWTGLVLDTFWENLKDPKILIPLRENRFANPEIVLDDI